MIDKTISREIKILRIAKKLQKFIYVSGIHIKIGCRRPDARWEKSQVANFCDNRRLDGWERLP